MKLKLSAEFLKRCAEGDDIPACPHCGVMAGDHLEGCPKKRKSIADELRAKGFPPLSEDEFRDNISQLVPTVYFCDDDQEERTMASKNEPGLYHGGLMRCCVQTWYETDPLPAEPGARIACKHCSGWMRRREDGDWEWDREEALKNEPGSNK